jgi:hypothetical protein
MFSFLKKKSPVSSVPQNRANVANNIGNPIAPKHKSSVLNVLNTSTTGNRSNSVASDPGSVGRSSFASNAQANLVAQRVNAPTNIWTQQRPNVLKNAKANIAAKLAQEKQEKEEEKARHNQWARQNRTATMKRRGRAVNYGTLIGLPHRNNVSASSPVENVAMSYPVPTFRKRSTRRNRRH